MSNRGSFLSVELLSLHVISSVSPTIQVVVVSLDHPLRVLVLRCRCEQTSVSASNSSHAVRAIRIVNLKKKILNGSAEFFDVSTVACNLDIRIFLFNYCSIPLIRCEDHPRIHGNMNWSTLKIWLSNLSLTFSITFSTLPLDTQSYMKLLRKIRLLGLEL